MNYDKHYCIEVTHQYGVKTFECESFWDAAQDEISSFEYQNFDAAVEYFGDAEDVPVELSELLKSGPALEITCRDEPEYYSLANFDKEKFAIEILSRDLNRLIVINSADEARKIAESYNGHEWMAVRAAARNFLESKLV